jgi:sugar lactone lactonase YvrE
MLIPGLLLGPFAMANSSGGGKNVLVQGAAIHGSDGIYCDGDDNLYISCVWGSEVMVIDQSGNILDRLGPDDGVDSADDVFIAPDGSVYWTSLLTGDVGRIEPDGTLTIQKVARGVNPITMSDDGRLFAALAFMGDGLYELDPDLVDPPILLHGPLGMLNGFDFGPDGYLYAPVFTKGEIVRIDVGTNPATIETLVAGLPSPSAVKFDSQGRLHAVDGHTGDVIRVDTDTGAIEVVAHVMEGISNLAFDSQDKLFVCQYQDGTIFQVLPGGEIRIVLEGGMIFPGGVGALTCGDQEHVFVGDFWTIKAFDGGTGDLLKVERHMDIGASLSSGITVSADGDDLIVSSWVSSVVYTLDTGTGEVMDSYMDGSWLPMDAMRFMGDIVFTDLSTGSIKKVDNTTIASGFYVPTGLAAIGDDLYVADWASGMVWQVFDNGNPTMVPVATDLSRPEGLTDDIDGNLLVVETGAGRLSRIDIQTGTVSLVADNLALGYPAIPGFPPTWVFNGVDVGPSGNIYVTGDVGNVLYRIKATERISRTIEDLPDEAFREGGARRCRWIIKRMLGTSQSLIDKGKYGSARALLKFLRRRMDGTGRDYITDPGAQQALMALLDVQISSLTQQTDG